MLNVLHGINGQKVINKVGVVLSNYERHFHMVSSPPKLTDLVLLNLQVKFSMLC